MHAEMTIDHPILATIQDSEKAYFKMNQQNVTVLTIL